MIILFTDGYTEFPFHSSAERKFKEEQSALRIQQGLQTAQQMDCEIFVVGLNYDNSIKNEGRHEIHEIANSTQIGEGLIERDAADTTAKGKVNYSITGSILGVQNFYEKLFAYFMNTVPPIQVIGREENGWTYYDIAIDTPNIFAVNVYITSTTETIGAITLKDPSGELQDISGIPRGNGYALLTIPRPAQGVWLVGTEGSVRYDVTYVPISTTYLQIESFSSGAHGTFTVQACYEGSAADRNYYSNNNITFSSTVTEEDSGKRFAVDLSYN